MSTVKSFTIRSCVVMHGVLRLTADAHGGGVLQSVLLQLPDLHLSRGGYVGPGAVRHTHLQAVPARRSPLPDAELTRALVQTEQPERETDGCFMYVRSGIMKPRYGPSDVAVPEPEPAVLMTT